MLSKTSEAGTNTRTQFQKGIGDGSGYPAWPSSLYSGRYPGTSFRVPPEHIPYSTNPWKPFHYCKTFSTLISSVIYHRKTCAHLSSKVVCQQHTSSASENRLTYKQFLSKKRTCSTSEGDHITFVSDSLPLSAQPRSPPHPPPPRMSLSALPLGQTAPGTHMQPRRRS